MLDAVLGGDAVPDLRVKEHLGLIDVGTRLGLGRGLGAQVEDEV